MIIDRAFGLTLLSFFTGTITGFIAVYSNQSIQHRMLVLLQYRVVTPIQGAISVSPTAAFLLIAGNNTLPVLLSFIYPILLGKIRWTPPLTEKRLNMLLVSFSTLCGFMIGFFNLGGTLTVAYMLGGQTLLNRLVAASWIHAPLEFFFVLLGVAEPLRLVGRKDILNAVRKDSAVIFICVIGLLLSAAIEIHSGL